VKYFQLMKILVNRELTLRYKRSFIGIGWTLINPILTSFVLWVIFSYVWGSRLPQDQQFAPYLMAGVLLMNFFNQSVMLSSESIMLNSSILTKVKVPPPVFPISTSLAGLVNFLIGLIPLTLVCIVSGQSLSWMAPLVIFVGICMAMFTAGVGLILSILYIRFEDMRNVINVLLMILMYFTPVFYPLSILSPRLQEVIGLNPLNSFLEAFRWAFSNNSHATIFDWSYMLVISFGMLGIGSVVFKRFWPRTAAML
jgi:ABC-2 type transport system permease protein